MMYQDCLNLYQDLLVSFKRGDVIYLGPHPINSGDVYGIFVVTEQNNYGFMLRATGLNKKTSQPNWTRFSEYSRGYWSLAKCEMRRIA